MRCARRPAAAVRNRLCREFVVQSREGNLQREMQVLIKPFAADVLAFGVRELVVGDDRSDRIA